MRKNTRQDIKTIGVWTLQRWELSNGEHTYFINAHGKPVVALYVNSLPDFNDDRMEHTVICSPYSRPMDLEEAAEFVEQTHQALDAAVTFQQEIDAIENVENKSLGIIS